MTVSDGAGLGGLGFVLTALVVNLLYVRARLPLPMSGKGLDEVMDSLAAVGVAVRRPSVLAPLTWLCTTIFAAGLATVLWESGQSPSAWALMGFGGVLMQNVAFSCVEALRFGLASAAAHDRGSTAGLWALSNVLFGFNQVFLATALVGFSIAGAETGFLPLWQQWLGYGSAALLFVASSASAYNAAGTSRTALIGLVGWLGWIVWIVASSITLLDY
ncbi:2-oxoglutarate/malate transporter [Nocardia sp. NPDC023852]|uniref:2-oxoglutarate/malate transporter n=1 Tax=Nocardia sp. NPDC023852 TaxID=3154697 RepID=UPI0033EB36E5